MHPMMMRPVMCPRVPAWGREPWDPGYQEIYMLLHCVWYQRYCYNDLYPQESGQHHPMRENRFSRCQYPALLPFLPPLAPMTSGHSGVLMYSVFVVITLSSLRSSGQQPLSPLSIHRAMVRNCGPISTGACTPSELDEGIIVG